MNCTIPFKKSFLPCLFVFLSSCSHAQQKFTITSSRENNYCNGTCTLFDNPDLNGNSAAIIFVTPAEGNGITHPLSVYYINKKWGVINADNTAMAPGLQFNVEYYSKPDETHFVHVVTKDNLVKYINSYIDHAGLNDNPGAQIQIFQNWSPGVWGGNINRNEIKVQYDANVRKWFISNANEKQLEFPVAFNIMIASGGQTVEGPIRVKPDISIKDPKTVVQPVDNATLINKPVSDKVIAPGKVLQKAYDFSDIHICIDKGVNKNIPARPATGIPAIPKIKPNGEIETVSSISQSLTGVTDLMWSPGQQITVGFSSASLDRWNLKIMDYIKEWETWCNIHFVSLNASGGNIGNAQIRIGFEHDGTSWSWVGRQVLDNPTGEMTMNFGWIDNKTTDAEFKRVVLHEFGHALGFIDEYQPTLQGIPWDKDKTYSFFAGLGSDWNHAKVDQSVFAKYSSSSINSSQYDRLSIMHYSFPPGLTTDGSTFPLNYNLSATDKSFGRQVYPFPPAPATDTGVLRTGDDCDEIAFTVEYNVVHSTEIEFTLKPGIAPNGNLITWWKKIAIPEHGGYEIGLEMQDGHSITKSIQANMIDKSKGISFGKAKFAGVHTGLAFTWNAWPAIIGGCRVTLVWRRDGCGGL